MASRGRRSSTPGTPDNAEIRRHVASFGSDSPSFDSPLFVDGQPQSTVITGTHNPPIESSAISNNTDSSGLSSAFIYLNTAPSITLTPPAARQQGLPQGAGRAHTGTDGPKADAHKLHPTQCGEATSSQQVKSKQTGGARTPSAGMNAAGGSQQRFMTLMELNKRRPPAGEAPIPISEVGRHCSVNDCWVAFGGNVYDITPYLQFHPGGKAILLSVGGTDCTRQFKKYHPWVNGGLILKDLLIGELATERCDRSLFADKVNEDDEDAMR